MRTAFRYADAISADDGAASPAWRSAAQRAFASRNTEARRVRPVIAAQRLNTGSDAAPDIIAKRISFCIVCQSVTIEPIHAASEFEKRNPRRMPGTAPCG